MDTKTIIPLMVVGLLVVSSLGMASAATVRCKGETSTYKNSFFKWMVTLSWCYDGKKITSYSTYTDWSNADGSWVYGGITESDKWGGVGQKYVSVEKTAKFQKNFFGLGTPYYPWAQVRGNADGTYTTSKGMYKG